MQAHARSLGNALDMIDEIFARIPKGEVAPVPLEEVLLELERAKVNAMVKFESLNGWMKTMTYSLLRGAHRRHGFCSHEGL